MRKVIAAVSLLGLATVLWCSLGTCRAPERQPAQAAPAAASDGVLDQAGDEPRPDAITGRSEVAANATQPAAATRGNALALHALRGRVVDEAQQPIAQARVACTVWSTDVNPAAFAVTDAAGQFRIACEDHGDGRVVASKQGYAPAAAFADTQGDPVTITLKRGVTVRGVVQDERGRPIAGAQVALALGMPIHDDRFPNDSPCLATTGADGRYELSSLPAGGSDLRATESVHDVAAVWVEVAAGGEGVANFTIRHVGLVYGVVIDAQSGQPIAGATINDEATTDRDGGFAIKRLLRGEVGYARGQALLSVDKPGYMRKIAWAAREDDGQVVRVELARPAHLSGRVVDRHQVPIANANIAFHLDRSVLPEGEREDAYDARATSDALGTFRVDLVPGVYQSVEVWHDQFGVGNFPGLTLRPEQSIEREFALQAGAEVRGRVLDAERRPVAGAEVRTWARYRPSNPEAYTVCGRATCDASGGFFIRGIEARSVWVSAQASGWSAVALEVAPDPQRALEVELVLERGVQLTGLVVDDQDVALPHCWVTVQAQLPAPLDGFFGFADARTDAHGRFAIADLPAVPIELSITPPSRRQADLEGVVRMRLTPPFAPARCRLGAKIRATSHP